MFDASYTPFEFVSTQIDLDVEQYQCARLGDMLETEFFLINYQKLAKDTSLALRRMHSPHPRVNLHFWIVVMI